MTASAAEVEAAQKAAGCRWESGGAYGKPYCGRHQYALGRWMRWDDRGCEFVVAVADAVVAAAQPRIAAETLREAIVAYSQARRDRGSIRYLQPIEWLDTRARQIEAQS